MNKRTNWISTRIRAGWIILAAGIFVAVAGVILELRYASLPYNVRIVTGLGILLIGIGVGYLVRYRGSLKNEQTARQLVAEERDERNVLIRTRAGNRAYWVSTALVYLGLMWSSFAGRGDLPDLNGDRLWYFLAAGVILPFGVYAFSILVDQRSL